MKCRKSKSQLSTLVSIVSLTSNIITKNSSNIIGGPRNENGLGLGPRKNHSIQLSPRNENGLRLGFSILFYWAESVFGPARFVTIAWRAHGLWHNSERIKFLESTIYSNFHSYLLKLIYPFLNDEYSVFLLLLFVDPSMLKTIYFDIDHYLIETCYVSVAKANNVSRLNQILLL